MTRRDDLIQFFLCANSSQQSRNFDLCKYVDDYLIRNPSEALILPIIVKSVKEKKRQTFEEWRISNGYKFMTTEIYKKDGIAFNITDIIKIYNSQHQL